MYQNRHTYTDIVCTICSDNFLKEKGIQNCDGFSSGAFCNTLSNPRRVAVKMKISADNCSLNKKR